MARNNGRSTADEEPGALKTTMKWVGIISAVLSLVFGIREATNLLADSNERGRRIDEIHAVGLAQQAAGDYPQAWSSFERAMALAEDDNILAKLTRRPGERRELLRVALENLAMTWLDDLRVNASEAETFGSVVDKLVPVLHRGDPLASGVRRADLLAHIGWAYFLKVREGNTQLNPLRWYDQSLAVDSANPYAHAYRGHWLTWNRQSFAEAMQEFDRALASERARAAVRALQLAAIRNAREDGGEVALLRVVNDMRKSHEPIAAGTAGDVTAVYYGAMRDEQRFDTLIAAVPPSEQLATLDLLYGPPGEQHSPSLLVVVATLQEAVGEGRQALQTWLQVRAHWPPAKEFPANRATAAIRRLSKKLRAATTPSACVAAQACTPL